MQYTLYYTPSTSNTVGDRSAAGSIRLEIDGVIGTGVILLPSSSYLLDPEATREKLTELLKSRDTFFTPDLSMLSIEELTDGTSKYEALTSFSADTIEEAKQKVTDIVTDFPTLIPELYL